MEVYIYDMLVKSLNASDNLEHLQETFDILRNYNMKLNPEKCAFEVGSDKFLGFLVSQRGIEVNPNKIKVIEDIPDYLTDVKEVQRLTGHQNEPLTNNEVEYEALIVGLDLARGLGSKVIEIKCDSQPVVNQVYGVFDTTEERMQQYLNKVQALLSRFRKWSIVHIPREKNMEADALANLGSST
nr:uncharacterized protein Mb2253c-like [Nicotiana tomentosiformis]